jgi:hypothetical protein
MGGPFDRPQMNQQQYYAELASRGFVWNEGRQLWVGPFGITVTGVANQSHVPGEVGRDNPMGIGNSGLSGGAVWPGVSGLRKTLLAEVDERLRAKRGQPRPHHRPSYNPPNPTPPPH